MMNLLDIVNSSFSSYAAMTIQDRAIIDARDGLKPSQRQCMYAQYLDGLTYKKPFKKSAKSISAAMDKFYVHGDSSCYDLLSRMAKIYTMRYPLMDFEGQYGTLSTGNPSAYRYTEMRLGELGCKLFNDIEKNGIKKWFPNYDDTLSFPSVTPSLGFYNLCNGTMGLAVSLACSIPQFNLKEINEAMIKLLWDRDISYDEIYCAPDFCTGSDILNASEVKEILKTGHGGSVRLRSKAEYDAEENAIYFTKIPYGVYTGKIMENLQALINNKEISGITKILDLSTDVSKIKICLEKGANSTKITKLLYKKTALENCYSINIVMLDNGTTPKAFGWREALLAHIEHEISVRTEIHKYDIEKALARIHIIDGLLLSIANIEEVVEIIKGAGTKEKAKIALCERFGFDDIQVSAILKMTLSKLINLEIRSYKDEKEKLLAEIERIESVLNNKDLLYKEIEAGLRETAKKFGDERRSALFDLVRESEDEDAEPIEEKSLLIHYTNLGNIYTQESSTLLTTRRGGKGSKIKMGKNETIVKTINDTNIGSLLAFTNKGKMYSIYTNELPMNSKINCNQLFSFEAGEVITTITTLSKKNETDYFVFITKNGLIKKTKSSEYTHKRGKSLKAINLKEDDEVVNVLFLNNEKVGILTNTNNFVIIDTESVSAIGRATAGVKAIKLDNSYVIDCKKIKNDDKFILSITKGGLCKKTSIDEYGVSSRGIKGNKIMKTEEDSVIKFLSIDKDCEIIIVSQKKMVKINSSEFRSLSKNTIGSKSTKLDEKDYVVDFVKETIS